MGTRRIEIASSYRYETQTPTAAVFLMEAPTTPRAQISEAMVTFDGEDRPGSGPVHRFTDETGNHRFRVVLPAGVSTLRWSALATIPDALDDDAPRGVALRPAELPDETLVYTLASRFCESDRLSNEAWRLFGATPGGYDRVRAIMDFVNSHLTYTSGSSGPSTSALDVLTSGTGVCRDYAHLMVALCRAMNLPARYAFGYFPDIDWTPDNTPMDFHAWVQVWIGDGWYDFDPRHNVFRKGKILVGVGRDAADTALVTTYGPAALQQLVVDAQEVGTTRTRPYFYG